MGQVEQIKEKIDVKNLGGGLEILVQLAEKGDIDPWDIDIIDLTDKYLAALDKSPRENLLNAGRAIFFASVLLRLKSDILLNLSNETLLASQQTENFFPEDEILTEDGEIRIDVSKLESFLVRSSLSKQQRKRKILLTDLIFALQQAEEEEERRAVRAKLRAERAFTIIAPETPDDLLEITQEEDLDKVVEKIEAIIEEHLTDEKPITLSFLSKILNDKIKSFIALLFLAHVQKVVLVQNEMYSEVYVYRAGTVIEEPEEKKQEAEKQEAKKQKVKKKKKGIIEKIKDKITGKKDKPEEDKIIDQTEINNESEVTDNGNHPGESGSQ